MSKFMFKILVIEDEEKIRKLMVENLKKWNFEVVEIEDFENILNKVINTSPHVILLDINLPFFDGFYWCSKIREFSKVPIIFISSRSTNMDIIMAMNLGGDDFIQKPFSMDIVIAKINAVLRRTYSYVNQQTEMLEYNGIALNLQDSSIFYQEKKIELTKNEFQILYLLLKKSKTIVSRENLIRALWEDENFVDDNTLTVNINRLRKKLSDAGLLDLIKTKKGQGYILE